MAEFSIDNPETGGDGDTAAAIEWLEHDFFEQGRGRERLSEFNSWGPEVRDAEIAVAYEEALREHERRTGGDYELISRDVGDLARLPQEYQRYDDFEFRRGEA